MKLHNNEGILFLSLFAGLIAFDSSMDTLIRLCMMGLSSASIFAIVYVVYLDKRLKEKLRRDT